MITKNDLILFAIKFKEYIVMYIVVASTKTDYKYVADQRKKFKPHFLQCL